MHDFKTQFYRHQTPSQVEVTIHAVYDPFQHPLCSLCEFSSCLTRKLIDAWKVFFLCVCHNGQQRFGTGYHFKIFRSQVPTRKKVNFTPCNHLGSCAIPIWSVTPISARILGRSAPQLKGTSQCSKFKFFRNHLLVTSISINWLACQKLIVVCKTKMYLN